MRGVVGDTLCGVLKVRRELLIACWTAKIRAAVSAPVTSAELLDSIPAFVDEIIAALYPEALPLPTSSGNAGEHGAQRLRLHFDVAEVVREYGLLHECLIEIARDAEVAITPSEQRMVVRWVTAGIADALAQYIGRRDQERDRQESEYLGFIAHELRNPLSAARAVLALLRARDADAGGGRMLDMLERSLRRVADMLDNALSHASLTLGADPRPEPVMLPDLFRTIDQDASLEAQARDIDLSFEISGEPTIIADPRLLRSAIFNLVHNGLKFSQPGSVVTITARTGPDRATFEVADGCGGLPPGKAEDLFSPLVQRGEDRTGFGLGLAIARQAVEAQRGTIGVHDRPGIGCVFRIALPQPGDGGNPDAPAGIEP